MSSGYERGAGKYNTGGDDLEWLALGLERPDRHKCPLITSTSVWKLTAGSIKVRGQFESRVTAWLLK